MNPLIVANWKLNKTESEAIEWLEEFGIQNTEFRSQNVETVICSASVVIPELQRRLEELNLFIKLGAQDVSRFEKGQYTGEVSAKMLQGLIDYAIVGHSERRRYFGETDEIVAEKAKLCLKYGITPILCVSSLDQLKRCEDAEKLVIAYEPLEAISTGGELHPDDPDHASKMAGKIKETVGDKIRVIYGGSVNEENAKSFVDKENIDGLLVGQASLDATKFAEIVRNCKD